ncbi:hypothetical protein [Phormidium sp. CCY1219]|uniref:hypothetical protein n=1 Tax=Phormidium sp. CCY1219 TaxID=2886104 RepID=UPI002D1EB3DF|nr:hypothetical protein [Phormidium sp. CCY1219]MEB3826088.1 hypothetical protein [Phormidium sp. CCY1219]
MLYLAQVQKKGFLGKTGLRLLACQKPGEIWVLMAEKEEVFVTESSPLSEGVLVLVELSHQGQIRSVKEATEWVMSLVEKYLNKGITPEFLQWQTEEIENWRQSLTLQSQELSRRELDLEARRDQIQELEDKLKQERRRLEALSRKLESENKELH